MMLPTVTVIIPIYNASETVSNCFNSLLNQTYPNIEVIVVDDFSTDDSSKIIASYSGKFLDKGFKYKILTHSENKGVATARNTGLSHAQGDYIYYVDADDSIDSSGIDKMVRVALEQNADIVCCDWYLQFNTNARRMHQPKIHNYMEAIEFCCKGVMRWNLWLFMVKRDLYKNDIKFIDGNNMGEDMMVMFKLFCQPSVRIVSIDFPVYYYGQSNEISLTKTYNSEHKRQVTANLEEIVKYYNERSELFKNRNSLIHSLKLNIKLPLLITADRSKYIEWLEWFKESNSYIFCNDKISLRIKVLQIMAIKKQFWFIKLHYYLVVRFVYGILYK